MHIIQCNEVSKTYKADIGKTRKKALQNLSFAVEKGEVFGIIGRNGAGKSTTLKILMDFVKPDRGTLTLAGLPHNAPESRNHVGFLPETSSLYPQLSLKDHLQFAARITGLSKKETNRREYELAEQVELTEVIRSPIRHYSKGMRQRAALALALLHQPEILILDEPMSGLDPFGRQLVLDIIGDYNSQGNTILFCSHILTDVERICHRIGVMDKGSLVATTTPAALETDYGASSPAGKTALETYFFKIIDKQPHDSNLADRST